MLALARSTPLIYAAEPTLNESTAFREFLEHPAVQAGVAPFMVGLVVAAVFCRLRLGGLALVAGFATAVALVAGFTFSPLTATRKIILLTLLAPIAGLIVDFLLKRSRPLAWGLAMLAGLATLWAFYTVLIQKDFATAIILGGVAAGLVGWLVGYSYDALADRPVAGGAAALMMGFGAGVLAVLGASASFGQYGIALGAGAGALLLVMMITGRAHHGGAIVTLTAAMGSGLLVSGTVILAQLQWYAALIFALTPVAVRIPVPVGAPFWLQAVMYSCYALVPVAGACAAAYYGARGS